MLLDDLQVLGYYFLVYFQTAYFPLKEMTQIVVILFLLLEALPIDSHFEVFLFQEGIVGLGFCQLLCDCL